MDINSIETAIAAIVAVGAMGAAAYGVVEAFGKAFVIRTFGLPYVGFKCVRAAAAAYEPALRYVHGDKWALILSQQYRDGRGKGLAPDTIRQGVKLALPMMPPEAATTLVSSAWGMGEEPARALVAALQAEKAGAAAPEDAEAAATLAGRFALALDSRIGAAFTLAEERYQAAARLWAGVAAVVLSLVFNLGMKEATLTFSLDQGLRIVDSHSDRGYPWLVALVIGAAAVPLAPVAKDLSSSLSEALKSWKAVSGAKA